MPPPMTVVKLLPEHLVQVESWSSSQNALSTLFKLPGATASSLTTDTHGWAALQGEQVLAVVVVKLNKEHVGYLECRVKPAMRRQGIGSELVAGVLRQPEIKALIHLHATVDSNNIAAQKTLDENGFSRTGYAADGRIEFARHQPKN